MSVCAGLPHTGLMSTGQWGLGRVCDTHHGDIYEWGGGILSPESPQGNPGWIQSPEIQESKATSSGAGRQEGTWQIRSEFWKNPTEGTRRVFPSITEHVNCQLGQESSSIKKIKLQFPHDPAFHF